MNPILAMVLSKGTDLLIEVAIGILNELKDRPDNDIDQKTVDAVKKMAGKEM